MKKKIILVPILLTGFIMTSYACTDDKLKEDNRNTEHTITSDDSYTIYQFNKTANTHSWNVVNDGVMGGLSKGDFTLSSENYGVFSGDVSLENNGGFTSVRYRFDSINIDDTIKKLVIKVKGDGKQYQLRLKEDTDDMQSYVAHFETTGDWQTIEIALNTMYPSYRGRTLPIPNFQKSKISELSFLIANKKPESFELLIDSIILQ